MKASKMNRRNFLFLFMIIIVGVFIIHGISYLNVQNSMEQDNMVKSIAANNKEGFDSLQQAIKYENNLDLRIKKAIEDSNFITAYHLLDSFPEFGKREIILGYQGNILEQKGDFISALKKYDSAIAIDKYSITINDKARVLIKMGKYQEAINSYRTPFDWENFDNSLQIARTFLLMKKKDSSLKYYEIYLMHYPNDSSIKHEVLLLNGK